MKRAVLTVGCVVATIAMGTALLAQPAPPPAQGPAAPTSKPAEVAADTDEQASQKILDRELHDVQLTAVSLADAIDYFRDQTGLNVYVQWSALRASGITQSARVTYKAAKVKASDALKEIFKPLDEDGHRMAYMFLGKTLVISSPDALRDAKMMFRSDRYKATDPEAAKLLNREMQEVVYKRVPLREVMDSLRESSGITIGVDWTEIVTAGISRDTMVTVQLHSIPFSQALRLLLMDAGGRVPLDFTVEQGVVKVFVPNPL